MDTVALELVPTDRAGGFASATVQLMAVKEMLQRLGLASRLNTFVVPQVVAEDEGRPVPFHEKLDTFQFSQAVRNVLGKSVIINQITVYTPALELGRLLHCYRQGGVRRVVFVGGPRGSRAASFRGPSPLEALRRFGQLLPQCGVILIPTRAGEAQRFQRKLAAGASFAITQMLFGTSILSSLRQLHLQGHQPEIILSFAYVPRAELDKGLIRWLIATDTHSAQEEMRWVEQVAGLPYSQKKQRLVDLYRCLREGVRELGFPVGLNFECPYGVSEPALECLAEMLEAG